MVHDGLSIYKCYKLNTCMMVRVFPFAIWKTIYLMLMLTAKKPVSSFSDHFSIVLGFFHH